MLRSWTDRLAKPSRLAIGIALGASEVCAATLEARPGCFAVRAIRTARLAQPLFATAPTVDIESGLTEAMRAVCGEVASVYVPVHLALPDTVARTAVFDLDELPPRRAMRDELLRWRLAKEFARAEQSLVCRGLGLGEDRGKPVLLGQAVDRQWLACIESAAARAGIVPWSMNAAAVFRFNHFHDTVATAAGALVAFDPDCWSLLLWDDAGRPRYARARPHHGESTVPVLDEIERTILAYVNSAPGRRVGRVYVAGAEPGLAALVDVLEERLHEPPVRLDTRLELSGAGDISGDGFAGLALTAALTT